MGSAWVEHVKSVYAKGKKGGMSYKQAMQKAKVSWAKKKGKGSSTVAKKSKKKADVEEKVEKPKRAKKKARKQVGSEQAGEPADEPRSSQKARSSRANRSSVKRRDVAPRGMPGLGAPFKG
jgi:hypothetical protein